MVCEGRPGDQQSSRSKPFLLVDVPPPPPDWFGHADNIRLSSESKIQMGAFQDGLGLDLGAPEAFQGYFDI